MKKDVNDHNQYRLNAVVQVQLSLLLTILALLVGFTAFQPFQTTLKAGAAAREAQNQGYDPIVLPITAGEVQAGLVRNSRNATAEYELLLRAAYQHQEIAAFNAMTKLIKEQPNSAVVLAGYFLATKITEGGACTAYYNGAYETLPLDRVADDSAQEALLKAYKIAPNLWMTYAVDGEDQFYGPTMTNRKTSREQGFALLHKAEVLAPNVPYVHWLMANAYLSGTPTRKKSEMAAAECRASLSSGAKVADAAFMMFQIYSLWMPDPEEERVWKRKYLALVPPSVKMNPGAKQWLDKYP